MKTKLVSDFLVFLRNSPTPYHVAQNLRTMLKKAGYEELFEREKWSLKKEWKILHY